MSVWIDPLLKPIEVPGDLRERWFKLGSAKYQLLPKQYQFMRAHEEFVAFMSGYGGGKTRVGSIKAADLSMIPGNRGFVGMEASTDLTKSAQRDLMDFLYEAGLVKKEPTSKDNTVYIYCIDQHGKNTGAVSEIEFAHLDDPKHVRGRHLGWAWIDEGSKIRSGREAWQNLMGRMRLPAANGEYVMYVTGNPEGHNWIYDFFFNKEIAESLHCRKISCKFGCRLSVEGKVACNKVQRLKRRAFHCTSEDNYYLPEDYLDIMRSGMSEEDFERYVMASFDVFSGQIFAEWNEDVHVV